MPVSMAVQQARNERTVQQAGNERTVQQVGKQRDEPRSELARTPRQVRSGVGLAWGQPMAARSARPMVGLA